MSVGLPVTKQEVDTRSGDTCRAFQRLLEDIATMKTFLDTNPDQTLIDLGYTAGEVTILKSAFADLSQLTGIAIGQDALAAPKDFRAFARQLWGVGAF
jgi:hypothetical protein